MIAVWLLLAFVIGVVVVGIALLDYAASLGAGIVKAGKPDSPDEPTVILAGPDVSPEEYRGVLMTANEEDFK